MWLLAGTVKRSGRPQEYILPKALAAITDFVGVVGIGRQPRRCVFIMDG
jgi:hypothetical protein